MDKRVFCWVVCFLLIQVLPVPAQTVERFEHLNTSDGLSQNSVLSMLNDSRGYMWFGTMNGLNRYDGYNFTIFKVDQHQENTLTHNRISRIWEDARKMVNGRIHHITIVPEVAGRKKQCDQLFRTGRSGRDLARFHQFRCLPPEIRFPQQNLPGKPIPEPGH